MQNNAQELIRLSDHLFEKKSTLHSLWQDIAENFYIERADFTRVRNIGSQYASHLMDSNPVIFRRELGDTFEAMLRRDKWFNITVNNSESLDIYSKRYLEHIRDIQFNLMYARKAQFTRATKEGDHDYTTFGQCVISVETNKNADGLLYRCWHLKDVAWQENHEREIDTIFRRCELSIRDLVAMFGNKVNKQLIVKQSKDPFKMVKCLHAVIPSKDYEGKSYQAPYVSVFIDVENQEILEEVPSFTPIYIIPQWVKISGSQYAFSPVTTTALADARSLQSMALVLLEAGEKMVDPPLVASREVFRDDFNLMAGGITWADLEADQNIRDVITEVGKGSNFSVGQYLVEKSVGTINRAFYLNRLNLPDTSGMTAYEVSQRIQEYIRQAMPLFSPMETNYNGQLCEVTFDICMRNGWFGSPFDIPEQLNGSDIKFSFESPLKSAIGQEKQAILQNAIQLLASSSQAEQMPSSINMDMQTALRDAMISSGVPADWIRPEDEVNAILEQRAQQAQMLQEIAEMQQGANVVNDVSNASQNAEMAGLM